MLQEITVTSSTPMPKGYGFLPKGIRYKTLHCRKRTREAGKPLYLVVENKTQIGLRVPTSILQQVHLQAKETLPARQVATAKRDATEITKAAAELAMQFPNIPQDESELVLRHGFQKHSGRVGRTSTLPLWKKVLLAVIAHVRHRHTAYDRLLGGGEDREVARKLTKKGIERVVRKWGHKKNLSWYFRGEERAVRKCPNAAQRRKHKPRT